MNRERLTHFLKRSGVRRVGVTAVALLVLCGTFFLGVSVGYEQAPGIFRITNLKNKDSALAPQVDFEEFWKVWNTVNTKFVPTKTAKQSTDQEKVWGAIAGMVASLGDPFTTYFPPEEKKMFESEISGNFEGVGMEIGIREDILTVIAPLKGSPAERAGVRSGDKIVKINATSTQGMKVEEAVKYIRGPKGTAVKLSLLHEGVKEVKELSIIRDVIDIPTLDSELRSDGVFVIRLYNFSAVSSPLFRDNLKKFIDSGSDKLVLDLRNNPGGYLDAAVEMASWFLPAGDVVVSERFGKEKAEEFNRSKGYGIANPNLHFAILVNGGSASASEILAGALREHGIAKLVGEKTFGKGSVQELVPITDKTSLKVTIARWFTPNGNSISDGGLKPDFEVKLGPDDVAKGKDPQLEKAVSLLLKGTI